MTTMSLWVLVFGVLACAGGAGCSSKGEPTTAQMGPDGGTSLIVFVSGNDATTRTQGVARTLRGQGWATGALTPQLRVPAARTPSNGALTSALGGPNGGPSPIVFVGGSDATTGTQDAAASTTDAAASTTDAAASTTDAGPTPQVIDGGWELPYPAGMVLLMTVRIQEDGSRRVTSRLITKQELALREQQKAEYLAMSRDARTTYILTEESDCPDSSDWTSPRN